MADPLPPPAPPPGNRPRALWSRRRLLIAGATLLGGGLAAAGYTRWWEPGWFEINRRPVPLGGGPSVRLLQLSDLHASPAVPLELIARAVKLGLAERPDVVCLTGDFITKRFSRWADYAGVLRPLAQGRPVFASLGNHDGGKWAARPRYAGEPTTAAVRACLERAGIQCLVNQSATVRVRGRSLRFVGLGDLWAEETDPERAFAGAGGDRAAGTVVLSHNPDSKERLASFPWELILCGHTHGGQLGWFGLDRVLAPVRDKRFLRGLHRWNDRWLHVTKGVGNLHGVRLGCRPEVSVLELG